MFVKTKWPRMLSASTGVVPNLLVKSVFKKNSPGLGKIPEPIFTQMSSFFTRTFQHSPVPRSRALPHTSPFLCECLVDMCVRQKTPDLPHGLSSAYTSFKTLRKSSSRKRPPLHQSYFAARLTSGLCAENSAQEASVCLLNRRSP